MWHFYEIQFSMCFVAFFFGGNLSLDLLVAIAACPSHVCQNCKMWKQNNNSDPKIYESENRWMRRMFLSDGYCGQATGVQRLRRMHVCEERRFGIFFRRARFRFLSVLLISTLHQLFRFVHFRFAQNVRQLIVLSNLKTINLTLMEHQLIG